VIDWLLILLLCKANTLFNVHIVYIRTQKEAEKVKNILKNIFV